MGWEGGLVRGGDISKGWGGGVGGGISKGWGGRGISKGWGQGVGWEGDK